MKEKENNLFVEEPELSKLVIPEGKFPRVSFPEIMAKIKNENPDIKGPKDEDDIEYTRRRI